MSRDLLTVDGHAFSWRHLCDLRRQQLAARQAAEGTQPTLFALKDDARPATERTGRQRYQEPGLFDAEPPTRK